METAKTGKLVSAKARILIRSVVSGKTTELEKPTQEPIEVPVINKIKGQVIAKISDDKYTIMDLDTYETFDAKVLDENLKGKIQEGQKVVSLGCWRKNNCTGI